MEAELKPINDMDDVPDVEEQVTTIDYPDLNAQHQTITTFSPVSKDEIKVKVVKFTSQTEYLVMQTDYYTLQIQNMENNKVKEQVRSNHDIDWLSDTIRTKYPGIGIPVHRITVCFDAALQKVLTVQLFLNFILEHDILKNCPEIAYFLQEGVTYISFKKQQDAQFAQQSSRKGLSLKTLNSIFKSILTITGNNNNQKLDQLFDKYQLKQLMANQASIDATKIILNKFLQYRIKRNQLQSQIFKNQSNIIHKNQQIEQLKDQINHMRALFTEAQKKHKKETIQDYLYSGLYMQLVYNNLTRYLQLFSMIKTLLTTIRNLKSLKDFGEIYEREKYLKLLTNNMKRDIKYWLSLNNKLLEEAND